MRTPYVDELVRRLRMDSPRVDVEVRPSGAASVVWDDRGADHPVTLLLQEDSLRTAVTALRREARDLWPNRSMEEAGFNLLLVHLHEVIATRNTTEPLRITSDGLVWPDD